MSLIFYFPCPQSLVQCLIPSQAQCALTQQTNKPRGRDEERQLCEKYQTSQLQGEGGICVLSPREETSGSKRGFTEGKGEDTTGHMIWEWRGDRPKEGPKSQAWEFKPNVIRAKQLGCFSGR